MKLLQHKALWENIRNFPIDDPESDFPFSKKLQKTNNWSSSYTHRVIDEYRKFIFLCCILPRGASPSEPVDEAWHLHLTYTQNYWTQLCRNTLQKDIHHQPSRGGPSEKAKHGQWYHETLRSYQEIFEQPPPPDIWPASHFESAIIFDTYDSSFITKTLLFFTAACFIYLVSLKLFSSTGPQFLEGYLYLCAGSIAAILYLQRHKINRLKQVLTEYFPHDATVYNVARFFYGSHRCYQTMLVDLIRNSEIKPVRSNFLLKGEKKLNWQKNENPLLKKLHDSIGQGNSFTYSQGIGLLDTEETMHPRFKLFEQLSQKKDHLQLIIPLITIAIGIARMLQGAGNHKPVLFLLLEVTAFIIITAVILSSAAYSRQISKISWEIYRNEKYLDPKTDAVTASFSTAGMIALTGFAEYVLLKDTFSPYLKNQQLSAGGYSSGCGSSGGSSCGSGCGGGCGGCGS